MELEKLRLINNYSQVQVAEKLGLAKMTYHNYETGRNEPNIKNLIKIADFYNVSIDYLVGRSFSGDIGYLTEKQRSALEILKMLNERNLEKVVSFASGVLAVQE